MFVREYKWGANQFLFSQPVENALWATILEKAWAKVKGTFAQSQGGQTVNGLKSILGVPVIAE